MESESDGAAIKSFGLGFRDLVSSDVWLTANMDDDSFGLFIDVHVIFEHIFDMVEGQDSTLTTLHSIAKLDLANMTQALCLNSFVARVPKLLSRSSNLAVPTKSSKGISHFDNVETYTNWENQNFGTKSLITKALNSFEYSHQGQINAQWPDELARGRVLATKALNSAGSWIRQFISYVDETYNSFYRHSGFTSERAWEVTTQLARRIFIEVATPREGVFSAIKIGQGQRRRLNIVFWPMLKSHDIMKEFKDANFGDHPAISSEYVKFLAANSGRDNSDQRFVDLKAELVVANKNCKAANDIAV